MFLLFQVSIFKHELKYDNQVLRTKSKNWLLSQFKNPPDSHSFVLKLTPAGFMSLERWLKFF
jgi:hypothetical protein